MTDEEQKLCQHAVFLGAINFFVINNPGLVQLSDNWLTEDKVLKRFDQRFKRRSVSMMPTDVKGKHNIQTHMYSECLIPRRWRHWKTPRFHLQTNCSETLWNVACHSQPRHTHMWQPIYLGKLPRLPQAAGTDLPENSAHVSPSVFQHFTLGFLPNYNQQVILYCVTCAWLSFVYVLGFTSQHSCTFLNNEIQNLETSRCQDSEAQLVRWVVPEQPPPSIKVKLHFPKCDVRVLVVVQKTESVSGRDLWSDSVRYRTCSGLGGPNKKDPIWQQEWDYTRLPGTAILYIVSFTFRQASYPGHLVCTHRTVSLCPVYSHCVAADTCSASGFPPFLTSTFCWWSLSTPQWETSMVVVRVVDWQPPEQLHALFHQHFTVR